jgi:hypothetical protein
MDTIRFLTRTLVACSLVASSAPAFAQNTIQEVKRTPADSAAVATASNRFISAMAKGSNSGAAIKIRSDIDAVRSAAAGAKAGGKGGSTQYPGDLGDLFGGATIPSAVQHPLYLIPNGSSCNTPSCWGNVTQFLGDLNRSEFIEITDQYVDTSGPRRYPVSGSLASHYKLPANPLTDADMAAYAHAAAKFLGVSGYGHIFHIFLTPEQNVCFDTSYTVCSSNAFCAYHSSAVFGDIGEVVYTVEPNNVNVFGCNQPAGSPNGGFDATYSVLSHEVFETLTDPDGLTWFNITNSGLLGSEIGDECLFWLFDPNGNYISANSVVQKLNGHAYQIQTEYDNRAHACTTHPGG